MSTSCPQCGATLHSHQPSEAQSRISDLETQVRLLNSRASTYVDKLADYDEEIQSLRTQCAKLLKEKDGNISVVPLQAQSQMRGKQQSQDSLAPPPLPEKDVVVDRPGLYSRQSMSRLSNLASFLPGRRREVEEIPPPPTLTSSFSQSTPNLQTPLTESLPFPLPSPNPADQRQPPPPPSLTLIGLQSKLETERHLREAAEKNLTDAQSELEELTAQLFGQANEMVAEERRARAQLEERVKTLETRDGDKKRRLERLEGAVARIERVRRLVVEHEREMEGRGGGIDGEVMVQKRVTVAR